MLDGKRKMTLIADWDEALSRVTHLLESRNLRVVCSFNLQMEPPLDLNCSCPHHNSEACNCSMAVLLVYAPQSPPVSLLVHGHDEQISFMLDNSCEQNLVQDVAETVKAFGSGQDFSDISGEALSNAI